MRSQLTKLCEKREKRENGDQGFTLIELLVVVVIIGILVAIAIPVYLNFRKGAENRSAQSDTRNAVTAIEQCFNDGGQLYPTGPTAAQTAGFDITCGATGSTATGHINVSTGNSMVYAYTASTKTYTVATTNTDTTATYTYKSSDGTTAKTGG